MDNIRGAFALVRVVHRVNPEELDDDTFVKLYAEAVYVKQLDARLLENAICKALEKLL